MKAVLASGPGGPEVLSLGEAPDPAPAAGEVLLDVAATAVNHADTLQRIGKYPPPAGASQILGLECSGRIAALGEGVTGWQIGDEVCALLAGGGYAERVCVPATQLMRVPAGLDLISAAALPEVACTVWSMVLDGAPAAALAPGESFLVHGGSSGIGTMAIQLAAAQGCRVFTTAGTDEKLAACRELGAELAINYRDSDFVAAIREHTGGAGVDVVLDTVGAKYLPGNLAVLAVGGRISVIGFLGGSSGALDLAALMQKRAGVFAAGLRGRPLEQKAAIVVGTEAHVWPLVESGRVRPVVHEVLPLAQAADAHRILEASGHIGKLVLATG
ncbi:MAG: NAD(P)H-quinone oxidoreductase [Jatrophihabitantaceae bacterium]